MAAKLAVLSLTACSSGGDLPPERPDQPPAEGPAAGVLRLPFLVDDYFDPNGCFGDRNCDGDVVSVASAGCDDPNRPIQGSCRVFSYSPLAEGQPGYQGYLGILFQDVVTEGSTAIGRVPPLPVEPGARRVVFWAKVEGGPLEVAFRAGGANNWEGQTDPRLPYKDEFGVPMDVTIGSEFEQIVIDLSNVEYEAVVSPFGWAIETKGRVAPLKLFVADVRWE